VPKLRALETVPIATKADRLREVWPQVEAKLAGGASHADVLRALNEDGYDLTERTYKSYVYRFRKERRRTAKTGTSDMVTKTHEGGSPASTKAPERSAPAAASRPRIFDYDPRGIDPELLK
jgi:hypothetical protein